MASSRRTFLEKVSRSSLAILSTGKLTFAAGSQLVPISEKAETAPADTAPYKADHVIRSLPQNMVWGYFGADVPPIHTIKDGDVVEIQTVNVSGMNRDNPEEFYTKHNLPIDEHAREVMAILKNVPLEPSGIRGHMLTGPIYIDGAQPGDSIEIRILDLTLPADFGANFVRAGRGGIPEAVTTSDTFVYRYDAKRKTATLGDKVAIPIKPFLGVMALSPPAQMGRQSSIPPNFFGGNLDIKHLVKGTTLHLPVSMPGGLFSTGDGHAAQGNGEVSGTAIETALTLTAKFILHKGKTLKEPRVETPTHFIAVGLDKDLDQAMKNALLAACTFIQERLGYSFNESLSIASTGVDFEVSQVVDQTLGVHAMIPKAIFPKRNFDYWA